MIIVDNKIYDRSRAALEIARRMDGVWPAMYAFIIVPAFVRDFFYEWISRNRYRWFGVRSECMIPTPAMKARFL
jgi:predicted DCC family thiol-disulfide oxidoreductase YuxK